MNAEVFVIGREKCKLVSRLRRQSGENLDDNGCPKIQDVIVAEGGRKVPWICSSYSFSTQIKTSLRQKESQSVWRLVYATFKVVNFVLVFCICKCD